MAPVAALVIGSFVTALAQAALVTPLGAAGLPAPSPTVLQPPSGPTPAVPTAGPHGPAGSLESAVVALRHGAPGEALLHARDALRKAAPDSAEQLAAGYVLGKATVAACAAAAAPDACAADEAEVWLRAAVDAEVPFRDGARLALGGLLAQAGRGEEAVAVLGELSRDFRDGERRWEVGFATGAALEAAGRHDDAAGVYADLAGKWHPRLSKEEALFRLAGAREKQRAGGGADLYRRLALEHPETRFGDDALRLWGGSLSPGEERDRIFALYRARAYDDALRGLHRLLERAPEDLEVRLALGRLHGMIVRDDLEQAVTHLRFITDREGRNPQKAEAAWRLMSVLGALGRYEEALEVGRAYKASRYGTGWSSAVDYRMARLHHEAGHAKRASLLYDRYLKRHKPDDRTMYAWFVGWAAFRGGHDEEALKEFAKLVPDDNLLVGAKALYWSAVAHDRRGRRAEGVRLLNRLLDRFPLCYYAVLASRKLADWGKPRPLPGATADLGTPQDEQSPWALAQDLPASVARELKALEWLVAVGDAPEARARWETVGPALQRALPKSRWETVERLLTDAIESPHGARFDAWRRYRGDLLKPPTRDTAFGWRGVYPRAYRRFALPAAVREGIPELLLYSHMLQESRYKRFAISGAPAFGVMQFLDKSGRLAARDLGLPYAREKLFDPAYNIRLGAYYLGALSRKYQGQIPLAIAAYNGGPRLMDAHVKQFAGLPFDVFVEEIDRHETRNYVRKVLDHYVRYVHIYLPPDQRAAAIDAMFPKGEIDGRIGEGPLY